MIQYEIIEDPGLETEIFFAFIASTWSGIVFHILLISRLWNRNRDAIFRHTRDLVPNVEKKEQS